MAKFGETSLKRLSTCDPELQRLFLKVVRKYDCSVLAGHRTRVDQELAYASKRSKVRWPDSKHNSIPSNAIDIVPYPIDWGDTGTEKEKRKALARFYHFAGYVLAVAETMEINLRWGGDWDSDKHFNDQNFDDLPHFQLEFI